MKAQKNYITFYTFGAVQELPACGHSYGERPLDIQHEPGLLQAIPQSRALTRSRAMASIVPLGWGAERKASRNTDLKVYGKGLLIPSVSKGSNHSGQHIQIIIKRSLSPLKCHWTQWWNERSFSASVKFRFESCLVYCLRDTMNLGE